MFVYETAVHFDELDAMQMLHNARFVVHMERAAIAYFDALGHPWARAHAENPDQFHVVRTQRVDYLRPFAGTGTMRVEVWCERLGRTSCEFGFLFTSRDGAVEHARGSRTVVKLDPATLRPKPWTDAFRAGMSAIMRGREAAA